MILDLLHEVDKIKDDGNLVFIKFDGERESKKITIIISYPVHISRDQIRYEGDKLEELLEKGIHDYHNR